VNTLDAIAARRSIRKFQPTPVPGEMVETVLRAATLAPSAKNRQPWRFVILEGEDRTALAGLLLEQAEEREARGLMAGSCKRTSQAIRQAPVTILVFDPFIKRGDSPTELTRILWLMDIQSVGAAIQNMLLAAHELGLGSLWIGDVFFAEKQIADWLGREDQLIAAVTLGYPDQSPAARPRLTLDEVTVWGRGRGAAGGS
jgi:nitroreductase